ncbi:glycosyltransferase family 87 protein, partial [Acidiphilium sp. PM]|uniref:glycosyltransferase family 87 protein n=1 Tax=Acidiphilium sp. PM TaxID=1043206 RepID=UPI001F51E14A
AGPAIWPAFLRQGMAVAHAHLIAPFPSVYETSGVSVFWMARSLGAPVGLAGLCQGVSALSASVWCWHAWRRKEADPVARAALTVCLTLLVTPYAYANDMTGRFRHGRLARLAARRPRRRRRAALALARARPGDRAGAACRDRAARHPARRPAGRPRARRNWHAGPRVLPRADLKTNGPIAATPITAEPCS